MQFNKGITEGQSETFVKKKDWIFFLNELFNQKARILHWRNCSYSRGKIPEKVPESECKRLRLTASFSLITYVTDSEQYNFCPFKFKIMSKNLHWNKILGFFVLFCFLKFCQQLSSPDLYNLSDQLVLKKKKHTRVLVCF